MDNETNFKKDEFNKLTGHKHASKKLKAKFYYQNKKDVNTYINNYRKSNGTNESTRKSINRKTY